MPGILNFIFADSVFTPCFGLMSRQSFKCDVPQGESLIAAAMSRDFGHRRLGHGQSWKSS